MDVALLRQKIPAVQQWISTTLSAHQRFARPVSAFGFRRLPLFYPAELLSGTSVVVVERVPKPPLNQIGLKGFDAFEREDANAITYPGVYFIRRDAASRESLHFHELVHVVQWRVLGAERFLLAYAAGLNVGGKDSRESPIEKLAYRLEEEFEAGSLLGEIYPRIAQETTVTANELLGA